MLLKILSLYNHYCSSHPDIHIHDHSDAYDIEITDSKLEWFHKYSHHMKELNIANLALRAAASKPFPFVLISIFFP